MPRDLIAAGDIVLVHSSDLHVDDDRMLVCDLGVVRERITNLVGNRAVEMVETTMDEVDKGHYLAMKYLFEMIGLCPATTPEEALQEDSLARTLLRRLRLPEETSPSPEVTKDCATDPVEQEQESDAVK